MEPIHAPGEKTIYHKASAGFDLGEIIHGVSGLEPDEYLHRSFLEPLGMEDSFAGLPFKEQGRASRIYSGDPWQASVAGVFNLPPYRQIYLPAASLNTSARDLGVFYDML